MSSVKCQIYLLYNIWPVYCLLILYVHPQLHPSTAIGSILKKTYPSYPISKATRKWDAKAPKRTREDPTNDHPNAAHTNPNHLPHFCPLLTHYTSNNFIPSTGSGCYIAQRNSSVVSDSWIIGWEDVDPFELYGEEGGEVDLAIDTEERTLTLVIITKKTHITRLEAK